MFLGKTGSVVGSWYENNIFYHFWPSHDTHFAPGLYKYIYYRQFVIYIYIYIYDELPKERYNFQSIRKTEDRISIITNFVTLSLTKVKFLKLISFMQNVVFLVCMWYLKAVKVHTDFVFLSFFLFLFNFFVVVVVDFPWNMLGVSFAINKFNWNPVLNKNWAKTSNNC